MRDVVLAVHGGAGTLPRGTLTPEQELSYRHGVEQALQVGYTLINAGKSSLDAVEAAVMVLEDDPNFNAGRGAVFNADGAHELDASIMNGRDLSTGAVAGVRNTKNPISLARMVMERSTHVLLMGRGADIFALRNGVEYTTQDYFFTRRGWERFVAAKGVQPGETVGAVAVDENLDLAAATSTGGQENQAVGRVGDSPIAGAGTYADNRTAAVSCTGFGEAFIRRVAAYDICAIMEYTGASVTEAATVVLTEKIASLGATGGAIALDAHGTLATPHCSLGLINGYVTRDGSMVVRLYDDETPQR